MSVWFDVRTHSRESVSLEVDTDTDLDLVNEQERRDNRQLKSTEVLHAWLLCPPPPHQEDGVCAPVHVRRTTYGVTYGGARTVSKQCALYYE